MTDREVANLARGHLKSLHECMDILREKEYSVRLIEITHSGGRNIVAPTFTEIDISKTQETVL